jgi:predicted  nucleic acid-binding Zn-ribbon protein
MTQTEILWKYQEAEMEVDRLQKELEATPERQKLRKLRKILMDQSEKLDSLKAGVKAREAEIESGTAKLEALLKEYDLEQDDLNIMMNDEESTAEELTESRKAMEALLDKVNALKKSITECRDWIANAAEAMREAYSKGSKTKRDYEAAKTVVETEKMERKPVIDKAQREAERLAAHLPPEIVKKYNTIKKKYPNPVAKVKDNRCTGCGMSLPMTTIKKFASGNAIIECENCARILCRDE